MTPILSSAIREAIAKIDADCVKPLPFPGSKPTRLLSLYEILAATRAQGTDVAEALTVGMFGNGYMLSHQRRLLAIVAARALSEVASLVQREAGPEIVCLSGSTRFLDEMAVAAWEMEKAGHIVLSCHLLPKWYTDVADHLAEAEGVAPALDELHLRKIDLAARLHVINVGGYIGESTRREIAYAEAHGKPITYHDPSTTVQAMRALDGLGYA